MAVSQTQKNELYQFFTAAFDAAAGAVYINQLYDAAASGMTTKQIVNVFTTKPQFQALYPQGMSDAAFAASWIETLVGNSASANAKASAAAEITAGLNAGMSRGDVIYAAFTNLNAKPFTDPVWGETSKMFQNQLVVSKYYTEVMLGQETAVPYLQNVLSQVTPSSDVSSPAAILAVIGAAPGLANITLTPNQDSGGIFNGSIFSDTFLATQSTLQLGDQLNGGNGTDTLSLTISGSGGLTTGFSTDSVEVIKVKSLATAESTLDLSDVKGATTLFSYETDGAALTFHDIQSINGTKIVVVDTDESHTFQYDVGNSASNSDVAKIAVQEMRLGSGITLENNGTPGESFVDQIDLDSAVRADPGVQPSNTFKNDMFLVAGEDLDTLNITGDADLLITNVLDENISLVDAHTHSGAQGVNSEVQNIIGNWWELKLNLSNSNDGVAFADDGNVPTMTLKGSQGDNYIEFGTTNNDKEVILQGGNDWLRTGTGEAKVDLGAGNDSLMAGALNDSVNAGSGDDKITDNGSNYEGWKNGDSVSGVYYVPDYVAGGNYYDLGAGNDSLNVVADDSLQGSGFFSLNTVSGGADNDVISIHGSAYPAQSGSNWTGLTGYNSVDLGTGNDVLTVGDNQNTDTGHNSVIGGAGNDNIAIWQDGNQTVDAGGNDDTVVVGGKGSGDNTVDYTNGNHNIELGDGNDQLTVWGTSKTQNGVTTINAGSGDDYIYIEKDHVLRSNLGDGADTLQMRARDLMSEDSIVGGNTGGKDTIKLSNVGGDTTAGKVLRSETARTSQIEYFYLQDSGIRLDLTDNLFETAQDNSITVNTTESTPTPTLKPGYFNGMTRAQYDALGNYGQQTDVQVQFTDKSVPNDNQGPVYFLFTGLSLTQTVDMTPVTTPEFYFTLVGGSQRDIVIGNDATINGFHTLDFDSAPDQTTAWNRQDTLVVVDGAEVTTSDLRNVTNLEVIELQATANDAQDWHIELNTRVINQTTGREQLKIIVDPDVAAGSNLYITTGEDGWAGADTDVIVVRNSNVTVYVNGNVVSSPMFGNGAVAMFNGTFGLYVKTDFLFTTNPDNLMGTAKDDTFYASSIDQVQSSDNVDGKGQDNTNKDGNGKPLPGDTVQLGFGLANGTSPLATQLDHVNLVSIENLWFDTPVEVVADGFENPFTAAFMNPWALGLQTIVTGRSEEVGGDDNLQDINRSGLSFKVQKGNDKVGFDAVVHGGTPGVAGNGISNGDSSYTLYDFYATVDGGNGNDLVTGADNWWYSGSGFTDNNLHLSNVETVSTEGDSFFLNGQNNGSGYWNGGNDSIVFDENSGPTYAYVGGGEDTVKLDTDGTDGVMYIDDAELVWGGNATVSGNDTIDLDVDTNSRTRFGSFDSEVYGFDGADSINVYGSGSGSILVDGGTGNDTIEIDTNDAGSTYVTAEGGTGDDKITVGGNTPDYVTVWGDVAGERPPIEVETGADTIDVHADVSAWVNGQEGNDSINVQSDGSGIVYGDNGNDWIRVDTEGNQTVEGNYGNDTILGISDGSDNWIYGGEGNDAIAVAGSGSFSIVGGAGNDTISLGNDSVTGAYHLDVSDTVIFGNIDYDAVQVEDQNTQGLDAIKGFVFEDFSVSGDPLPKPQDLMDFTDFLVEWINPINMVVIPSNWTQGSTVNASPAGGNSIVVLSSTSTPSLSAMDFSVNLANTIQLNDNARAVVVVGTNGTSLGGGITEFDVYYVQDIDTGEGAGRQTWQVDKVADVTSATKVGVGSVLDNLLGGMTADPVVLVDNQLIDVQSNSDNFTIEWFDHELDGIQVLNFDANSGSVEDELDFFDGSDILQNVGNLSADVNVASGTVYLMEGEAVPTVGPNASDDVWTSGAAAGGQFVISDGDEAILIAGANQFSTSVNVFRLYDSDTTAVNVTAALTLIGTIDISSGSWITLSSDNFV